MIIIASVNSEVSDLVFFLIEVSRQNPACGTYLLYFDKLWRGYIYYFWRRWVENIASLSNMSTFHASFVSHNFILLNYFKISHTYVREIQQWWFGLGFCHLL